MPPTPHPLGIPDAPHSHTAQPGDCKGVLGLWPGGFKEEGRSSQQAMGQCRVGEEEMRP